jgi:hypothetical protein
MIPRYLPSVDLRARLQASRDTNADAATDVVATLVPGQAFDGRLAVVALRDGLNAYFRELAVQTGYGEIAMSAQICPLVPMAARHAGFAPRFVDIADDRPVPTGRQLASVIDASVKGVVIAPLYGHMSDALDLVLEAVGTRSLLVDLAQGIGLQRLEPLLSRADAVGFSFGIGKGVDTGGGLLLTRQALPLTGASVASLGVGALARSAALRGIAACGLYGLVAGAVERAAEAGPKAFAPRVRVLRDQSFYSWWKRRITTFLGEVGLAQTRAAILGGRFGAHPALAFTAACFSPDATHLRQIIRLADAGRRDGTLERLLQAGIDCAPAGEPLPSTYVPGERGDYPAARRFVSDAIRMPFLGRLSEREFAHLADAMERALA